MSVYTQKYQRAWKPDYSKLRVDDYGDEQAQQKAQKMSNIGNVARIAAPLIGGALGAGATALGAPPQAMGMGMQLGGAAGDAVGGAFDASGDAELDPIRRRELRRLALQQAIQGLR